MPEIYSNIIIDLKQSIANSECKKFVFHLPIFSVFNNTFFQSAETVEQLKDLFFKTLLVMDKDYLNLKEDKDLPIRKRQIFKIIDHAETSETLFIELINFFNLHKIKFKFNQQLSYFGSTADLSFSDSLFSTLIRENFRKRFYGINFENEINIGKKPIQILEALKFNEFLCMPCDYLYDS